jgi:cyclase
VTPTARYIGAQFLCKRKEAMIMTQTRIVLASLLLAGYISSAGGEVPAPFTPQRKVTRLAEGIFEIQHADALPGFPEGNTTVIIGEESVLVIDSGYLPSSTRKDIAQIRQWTNRPVRYLMNTHGHSDHITGNGIYAREFPGLTIIAHREARILMVRYTPGYPELFRKRTEQLKLTLQGGVNDDGKPLTDEARYELEGVVRAREAVLDDIATMGENAFPNLMIDQGDLTVDLGHREVQLRFLGRGNTAGDLVAFVPKEKIAVVGDLLVHPVPYTCSGFPVDWVTTLDKVEALGPATIVPGHGEVMNNLAYLRTFRDLLRTVIAQVDGIFQQIPGGGQSSLETAQKAVDVSAFRDKFPAGDQYNHDFFGRSVPNCLVRSVYFQLATR